MAQLSTQPSWSDRPLTAKQAEAKAVAVVVSKGVRPANTRSLTAGAPQAGTLVQGGARVSGGPN